MSNISLLTSPASSFINKMMPVYNGLPFVVNSTKKDRNNFKYIADVYVAGTKITTLKQNKDISNSSYGIFDIGRIVENYIETITKNSTSASFIMNANAYKSYYIKFGCEYERYFSITNIISSGSNSRVYTNIPHDLRVGDYVTIQNTNNYNGNFVVISTTSVSFVIAKTYVGSETSGTVIEAEQFYDNAYDATGYVGFAIPVSRPTRINVGDRVVVQQNAGATHLGYNGEWLVTKKYTAVIGGQSYTIVVTDCPWLGSSPVNGGLIYSLSKYNFSNLVTSTTEYAFDGGMQYVEWLSYNPTSFVMNLTNKGRFLTNSPKTLKIRRDETATLSFLHTSIMSSSVKNVFVEAFNSNNTSIGSTSLTLGSTANGYARLDVTTGAVEMEALQSFTLIGASYYNIYLRDVSGNRVSEIIKYEIDDKCYKFTQKRLKWKNRLGGWDYFTFNLRSDRTVEIDRSNFNKFRNKLNSSNKYTYTTGSRGNTTYNIKAFDKEKLQSNWLTGDEASWLEELFTSPEIYLIDSSYRDLPIIVTNDNIVIGEKENTGLISYTIDIEYSFNKIIQRN